MITSALYKYGKQILSNGWIWEKNARIFCSLSQLSIPNTCTMYVYMLQSMCHYLTFHIKHVKVIQWIHLTDREIFTGADTADHCEDRFSGAVYWDCEATDRSQCGPNHRHVWSHHHWPRSTMYRGQWRDEKGRRDCEPGETEESMLPVCMCVLHMYL